MTASLPSDSGPALAPFGFIEPHALLLTQPSPNQHLFKIMKAEHLIQSIDGGYRSNGLDAHHAGDRDNRGLMGVISLGVR